MLLSTCDPILWTEDSAIGCRILGQYAKDVFPRIRAEGLIELDDLDIQRSCACTHDVDRLWMAPFGDQKPLASFRVSKRKGHGFCRCCGFV